MKKNLLVASLLGVTLSACGGGASKPSAAPVAVAPPPPAPAPSPPPIMPSNLKGFFSGTFNGSRSFAGSALNDGTIYGIYASAADPQLVAGLIQGTGSSSNSTSYTSSNIKDFNLEGLGIRDASLSSTFDPDLFFNGTVTYVIASIRPAPFSASIFSTTTSTDPAAITGNYSGSYGVSPGGRENVTLSVSSTGAVDGTSVSGCHITGSLTPLSQTNALSLSLTFGPAPCALPTATISGVASYNTSSHLLYGGAPTFDRAKAAVFILLKR